MKPSDIFGIIVRVIGFAIAIWGAWNVLAGFVTLAELFTQTYRSADIQYSTVSYFGMGIPAVALGVFCLFFAEWIVRWTYRDK